MRSVTKSIPLVLVVVVVIVGGFFGVREYFLNAGVDTLKTSLRELVKAGRSGVYTAQCEGRGLRASEQSGTSTLQLRFTSSTEYVLEALCDNFSFEPLVVGGGTLPQFVSKVPGSSGFVYGADGLSGVALEVFGGLSQDLDALVGRAIPFISKTVAVTLRGSTVQVASPDSLQQVPPGPVTSCTGYGYFCCQSATQQGMGAQITGLTECKSSCYAQCVARPVVLSFTTNPFSDLESRTVSIQPGGVVEFMVVSDMPADAQATAVFDFGDGQTEERTDLTVPVSHVYSCTDITCEFTASVRIISATGVESSQSAISQVTVVVE